MQMSPEACVHPHGNPSLLLLLQPGPQSAWREPAAADSSLLPSAALQGCPAPAPPPPAQQLHPPAHRSPLPAGPAALLASTALSFERRGPFTCPTGSCNGAASPTTPQPLPAPAHSRACQGSVLHPKTTGHGAGQSSRCPGRGGCSEWKTPPVRFHSPGGSFHPGSGSWSPKKVLTFQRKVSNKAVLLWQWQPQAPPPRPAAGDTAKAEGAAAQHRWCLGCRVGGRLWAMSCSPSPAPVLGLEGPTATCHLHRPREGHAQGGWRVPAHRQTPSHTLPGISPLPFPGQRPQPGPVLLFLHLHLQREARYLPPMWSLLAMGTPMARHGRSPRVLWAAGCRLPWVCLPSTVQSPWMTLAEQPWAGAKPQPWSIPWPCISPGLGPSAGAGSGNAAHAAGDGGPGCGTLHP